MKVNAEELKYKEIGQRGIWHCSWK